MEMLFLGVYMGALYITTRGLYKVRRWHLYRFFLVTYSHLWIVLCSRAVYAIYAVYSGVFKGAF